ncbi:ubiquitin-like protein 5 [Angomonas deanei]|nr:ubiquitin-like protein 5 [Angomonas deanei]EPY26371.1 ubiquitin-like protein 5 [Angomonas deanei]|eukprot:EPY25868.1 ubiquitin-like protein 5 [Angomonas deanei]
MTIRIILQAMDQAALLVDNCHKFIRCGRGVLIYVAFLQEKDDLGNDVAISDERLDTAVQTIIKTKIFTHFSPEKMLTRAQSMEESPLIDTMIVPQASLAGKLKKGNTVQFHSLIKNKEVGEALYYRFVQKFREARGVDTTRIDINGLPLDYEYTAPVDDNLEDVVVPPQSNKEHQLLTGNLSAGWLKYNNRVICGTFGYRQGLQLESSGPFTHTFDL